ncbi:ORF6N domain-containing protein [uncultured Bilophila sp.]|uniref:ORF6N domain-containing protein n=1 Tax=uncultured Bilophila sp. TaxID=529385 RepID=UPI0026701D5C|nr:ORF6N domain-containing protein [uncultured Bilophila sp.]
MVLSNITDLRSSVNHSISLPSYSILFYRNLPVMTNEMLAQAYDVTPKQIRQNYANNRERFTEGKHFFSISGQDLKDFRLRVENFDSQISSKVRVLILWTKRGAARHAKMLNSDRAWDVFELLEETFLQLNPTESLLKNGRRRRRSLRLNGTYPPRLPIWTKRRF